MRRDDLLLQTKLSPPRPHRRVLPRPALHARIGEALDYRLTVVQAGTGYSKTTALATLDMGDVPLFWYSVGEAEIDPQRFLSYLVASFRSHLPGLSDLPVAALHEWGKGDRGTWLQTIDALINAVDAALAGPALLVLDDYHFVQDSPEISALTERFIEYLPPDLHLIITTRYPLTFPRLVSWRARGEVLEINRQALAFNPEEIAALFRDTYRMELLPEELAYLAEKTEGWPIALQLVWQGLRNSATRDAGRLLSQGSTSLNTLFDYLALEVLGSQPPEIGAFLRDTSVLRELTPAACDAVRDASESEALLQRLLDMDLFVVALGERQYRYHHLFHDFLREQIAADRKTTEELHRRAAVYYGSQGQHEEAIYHWLSASEPESAASAIAMAGEEILHAGWLDTVAGWIDALPPSVVAEHPQLQALMGDIYRMRSRFEEALGWYSQAEQVWRARRDDAGLSRALRGQALVYLDTVRPAEAEVYLVQALRVIEGLADRETRARLLDLLAENKLNMGKPEEAEALRSEARTLREEAPGEDALGVRVKLRTGKLDEAERTLESWAETERKEAEMGQTHPPRAHRETLLVLSLIHAFRGEAEPAFELASEAIEVGKRLSSPFVTAVGEMRMGHAWQLRNGYRPLAANLEEAIRCYQASIALADQLSVRRLRAEAMWGLTRAYGFGGDLESARWAAAEGVETGRWAGDAWIVALIELALGGSYILAGQLTRGVEIMSRVQAAFRDCGDSFGRAASRVWLALAHQELGQEELFIASIEEALALCEANNYGFLFTQRSLLGPPDPHRLMPLLIEARNRRRRAAFATRLLGEMGLADIQVHPGYQLRVYTLGRFAVYRGEVEEIEPKEWQRDKARQLFQLLLAQRGRWLQREEIAERLWPNLSAEAAGRDFKVALNALNRAIEPARGHDSPFAYIVREGSSYRIRPEADLWVDAQEFERECQAGLRLAETGETAEAIAHLQNALRLYGGNYLPDALYEDWASVERERLLSLYLRSADRLTGALVERGRYNEALEVCDAILEYDPCWERAYRWMMLAYGRQGNRPMAMRTFQRCTAAMQQELGVGPSSATLALYHRIMETEELPVTVA